MCVPMDITYPVFKDKVQGQPAAFGDFDSDELTDMFILKDKGKSIEILFGCNTEPPLLQQKKDIHQNTKCNFTNHQITSVVPGDFNGDALMDLLVTVRNLSTTPEKFKYDLDVHILWGQLDVLQCPKDENKPLFTIVDQPLVINYDENMIVDLFGVKRMVDGTTQRMFWLFDSTGNFKEVPMDNRSSMIRIPQSHGFVNIYGGNLFYL